ncbi:PP2C family protein-serine/threonine phosphatase [Paramagnetospirillum magneticum]|uniref:Serine phosphatase RsbU n=1 Tax=Paramagnetospirillum magneticum (strain ATCC 700264 / AMB-1) TaxID=342108 RepID=Q2WA83_PARM1|nr:PP2C family protein-serine/threonine phosphatase [Paramagnetospirillum magneticum]BAE49242.1 Serine phosphatase RsbU [Paramagnetospirillum magneticum AMB-1]
MTSRLRGLTAKQAVVTVAVVLVLSAAGGMVELFFDWHAKRSQVQAQVSQIIGAIDGSAVEAAYQLSPQLAERVVEGLLDYEIIQAARLQDNFGDLLAERRREGQAAATSRLAELLFGDILVYRRDLVRLGAVGKTDVGRLEVRLSPQAVASDFYARGRVNVALGLARALGIVALVVGIFYAMITRPLLRLAQAVTRVDPGQPGRHLVPALAGHGHDELGELVDSLNALLTSSQRGLNERDAAQAELMALTHDLERRVAERTREVEAANEEIRSLNLILKAENVRMGTELDVSRRIQQMVLPTAGELAAIGGLDVATYMEPANEVGGDYYDILHGENGRVRFGIGDVTGHGLESGVVMLMTQSAVRTMITGDEDGAERVLDVLNRTIFNNIQRMGSDKNLTLALLDYRPGPPDGETDPGISSHMRISGQHESVIVARQGGAIELIDTMDLGMPLGLVDEIGCFVNEVTVALRPGDTVILYTDGITEAADDRHRLYGLDRLCDVISANWQRPAEAIKDSIIADVKAHIGAQPLYDDLTLIVFKQIAERPALAEPVN